MTPPGIWHSHHNESDVDAIVLPVQVGSARTALPPLLGAVLPEPHLALQDAGLHTYLRTLDIRFAPAPPEYAAPPPPQAAAQ